jgi:hypothetical protein
MNNPLPTIIIRAHAAEGCTAISPLNATIAQRDGTELPLHIQKAVVTIDWGTREPVTVDIKAIGGFAADMAAGLRYIGIDGRKFRLVEVLELP